MRRDQSSRQGHRRAALAAFVPAAVAGSFGEDRKTGCDFLGRERKLARRTDARKPIPESVVTSFEDPADIRAVLNPVQRIKATKVADGLGMLTKPNREKLSDAKVKRRIGAILKTQDSRLKTRDDATKTR